MITQPGPYGCPECGIDHPVGTRHRVGFVEAEERRRQRAAVLKAEQQQADPLSLRLRRWEIDQRHRGVPANAEAVAYAKVLLGDPCAYCGSREDITIDHITTVGRGGEGQWDNLTAACRSCNTRKYYRPLLQGFAFIQYRRWQTSQEQEPAR